MCIEMRRYNFPEENVSLRIQNEIIFITHHFCFVINNTTYYEMNYTFTYIANPTKIITYKCLISNTNHSAGYTFAL